MTNDKWKNLAAFCPLAFRLLLSYPPAFWYRRQFLAGTPRKRPHSLEYPGSLPKPAPTNCVFLTDRNTSQYSRIASYRRPVA